MLKDKKGFTLVEILAAVTILGIISSVAIIAVNKIIQNAKEEHYVSAEENMTLAGQSYVQTNRNALPKAIGQKTKIYLNDLIAANYIEPIKDYNGKDCDFDNSYVQIFKYSQKDYSYSAYLKCNGTTEGSSSGDNSGDSSEENKPVYESIPNIPVIEAKIQADKNKQDKTEKPDLAYIKIKGNKSATTKILYYSYVIYKDGNEVYNTGQIKPNQKADKLYEITDDNNVVEIKIPLAKYSPGKVEIIISTINIDGETATKTAEKILPDLNPPKCEYLNPEDNPALFKDRQWQNTPRKIRVKCVDGEGESGCAKDDGIYEKTFRDTEKIGEIIIADNAGHTFPCKVNVYIDKEPPTCTNRGDSTSWTNSNRRIYYGCTDTGGSECSSSSSEKFRKFETSTRTATIDQYTISDNAGNSQTCPSRTANVYVDKDKPECTARGDSTSWTKSNRKIYYGCTDKGGSECSSSSSEKYIEFKTSTKTATIDQYTISDNAGNSKTCPSRTANVYVDNTSPSCENISGSSTTWTNVDRTISFDCRDEHSGCKESTYSNTFSEGRTEIQKITISDNIGNSSQCDLNVYVDKNLLFINVDSENEWKHINKLANIKANISYSGTKVIIEVTVSREHNGLFDFIVPDKFKVKLNGPQGIEEIYYDEDKYYCDKGKKNSVKIEYTVKTKGQYTISTISKDSDVEAFNVPNLAKFTVS